MMRPSTRCTDTDFCCTCTSWMSWWGWHPTPTTIFSLLSSTTNSKPSWIWGLICGQLLSRSWGSVISFFPLRLSFRICRSVCRDTRIWILIWLLRIGGLGRESRLDVWHWGSKNFWCLGGRISISFLTLSTVSGGGWRGVLASWGRRKRSTHLGWSWPQRIGWFTFPTRTTSYANPCLRIG